MYLVTQEPEDHHSGQVPLQALGFLCWGPACPAEKVSKPFAFLRRGICVNVNLYLTNGILSLRMYQHLMIYYKCFHQVINVGPWQKAKGLWREQDGGGEGRDLLHCVCVYVFRCGPSPMQVVTAHLPPAPTPHAGHRGQVTRTNSAAEWAAKPPPRPECAEIKHCLHQQVAERTLLVVGLIHVCIL